MAGSIICGEPLTRTVNWLMSIYRQKEMALPPSAFSGGCCGITGVRELGLRKFKSMKQAQRFLCTHAAVSNLFNLGRHLVGAQHYRNLRISAFTEWSAAVL